MADLKALAEALIAGQATKVRELTEAAIAEGLHPATIVNEGLIAGMSVIGQRFKNNEVYVPEVLIAARAMHAGLSLLKPLLAEKKVEPLGRVVLGTVKGDLHDIGKNLVGMMFEGAGFAIIDIGIDASPEKFVEAVKTHKPHFVALSALLTTTMPSMKDTVEALKAAGVRDQVKVLVGGAPLTQNYATQIGADGYAPDAASAADLAKSFLV